MCTRSPILWPLISLNTEHSSENQMRCLYCKSPCSRKLTFRLTQFSFRLKSVRPPNFLGLSKAANEEAPLNRRWSLFPCTITYQKVFVIHNCFPHFKSFFQKFSSIFLSTFFKKNFVFTREYVRSWLLNRSDWWFVFVETECWRKNC